MVNLGFFLVLGLAFLTPLAVAELGLTGSHIKMALGAFLVLSIVFFLPILLGSIEVDPDDDNKTPE